MKRKFDAIYENVINESIGDIFDSIKTSVKRAGNRLSAKVASLKTLKKKMKKRIREYFNDNGWKLIDKNKKIWQRRLISQIESDDEESKRDAYIVKIQEDRSFIKKEKRKKCRMKICLYEITDNDDNTEKGDIIDSGYIRIELGADDSEIAETIRETFDKFDLADEDESDDELGEEEEEEGGNGNEGAQGQSPTAGTDTPSDNENKVR